VGRAFEWDDSACELNAAGRWKADGAWRSRSQEAEIVPNATGRGLPEASSARKIELNA
jgi:hypothetical protein